METVPANIERRRLAPHPGAQTAFLACPADVVFYGGTTGPGKTWSLCFAALRHFRNPEWRAVIFRRQYIELSIGGGLIDECKTMYRGLGSYVASPHPQFTFPSGAVVQLRALPYVDDIEQWQGAQLGLVAFDELPHFAERQVMYLLSRMRARKGSGIRPQMLAAMNPPPKDDPDAAWILDFVAPYLFPEGHPLEWTPNPEMTGRLRWFLVVDDVRVWADTREELVDRYGEEPLSFSFVPGRLEDNPSSADDYKRMLGGLSQADRERLGRGSWNVSERADFFKRANWVFVDRAPEVVRWVRYWDFAATEPSEKNPNPDGSAHALVGFTPDGRFVIADGGAEQLSPAALAGWVQATARMDGPEVTVYLEEERGSSGKLVTDYYQREVLQGYEVIGDQPMGDKSLRAAPWRTMAELGNVIVVRGEWNKVLLAQARRFPKRLRDLIDAVSGGYKVLCEPHYMGEAFGGAVGAGTAAEWDDNFSDDHAYLLEDPYGSGGDYEGD